jgi:hypothetical protein
MTRRPLVRCVLGLCLALPLAACGGSPSVDETAAEAGTSSPQHDADDQASTSDSPATTADAGGNGSGNGSDGGGNPGGPGGDPADGGGDAGVAQGKPGAPGDVAVFEERGVTYAEFRDNSAKRVCVDEGKCTLAPPHVVEGSADDPTQCPIENMDYSTGTHQNAEGQQVFLEGATVTVNVSCLRFSDPDGDGIPGDSSTSDSSTSESSTSDSTTSGDTTDSGTTSGATPPDTGDQSQG